MNLKLWKRGCAALLSGVMMWSQPLCALAESGDSVETTTERQEEAEAEECQEYASSSDASEKETEKDSESGIQMQEVVFADEVELINDLVSEEDLDDELATDSDADEIELTDDLEYDLASGSDADSVELTNDLLVEEVDPEWMTDELSYTFEWGDLVDGIPEIDFSDYILDGEIDGNAGIAMLSLDSDSDSGNYWSEQIDDDALDYYGLLVDYYDAVIGETGSVEEIFSLGEVGTFEAAEDYTEEMSNHLDGLKYYVYQAIYAFRYDYPMMFWEPTINCQVSVSCYEDADGLYTGTTTGRIKITCDLSDSEVYDMVDEITGVVDSFDLSGDTDYAVLKSVHDQICEIADYDDTLAADYAHSAYGALVLGVSVCEGYAKAFKVFCDELGIPCVLIVGEGGSGDSYGSHMWNYVQMDDGLWYGVDVTWDDQDFAILDACFLVGSNTLDTFADTFGNMHIEEPLTIVAGDSTVYLYYPTLAEERYVESEEDQSAIVEIPDENLKAALLETGDTNGDGEMSVAEMEGLSYLGASGREITDLTGLEYAVNLGDLEISNNQLTDLSPLSGLVNLYHLDLGNCGLTSENIGALSSLIKVNDLYLAGNQIDDISALAGMTGLEVLYLNDNFAVADISPLFGLENLRDLWLQNNLVEDLSPLSGLTNLSTLYLNVNQVADISPLSGLTNLSTLELGDNQIEDLSPVQSLVWLNLLTANNNQLTIMPDLTALEGLDLYQDGEPREMFVGNRITRDEFTGKFAENIEVTEAWLDLNSYDGTVVNDDTIVEIPDASLKSALLAAGDTDGDGEMTRAEMSYLDGFGNEWNGIVDLTGLEYAVNLTYLGLNNNEITDISPLAGLTRLTGLELGWNQIEDISPLSGLTNLNSIMLDDNQITDISPLQGLTNLTSLSLNENEIGDISPLQGLTNLSSLNLSENEIGDISPLQNLTNLRELWLNNCGLTDISVLANLTQLETLEIQYNQIGDISVLADLTNLSYLDAEGSQITDISPVSELTNLYFLDVGSNQITDISAVQNLTRLSTFYANSNELTTVPDLTALTELMLYDDGEPRWMFDGNKIPRDEFTGKFAEGIELTEEWLDVNSYDTTVIEIPDDVLREYLVDRYDTSGDGWVNEAEMAEITYLNIYGRGVSDLTGLEYATSLQTLDASWNAFSDLSPLSGLNLTTLYVAYNEIADVSPLAELTNLVNLALDGNQIEDVSPLSSLVNLLYLNLDDNQISDISALSSLVNLVELNICGNQLSDISAVAGLTSLCYLYATDNLLTTIPDLTALTQLELYEGTIPADMFSGNQILRDEFTGKFADSIEVTEEWLIRNSYDEEASTTIVTIPDAALKAVLVEEADANGDGELSIQEMRQLSQLNIYGCEVEDLTGLEYAMFLTQIDASWNSISDLTPLSGLSLGTLYIADNMISDISPLAEVKTLRYLALDANQIEDISALSTLVNLRELDIFENQISDISALAGKTGLEYLDASDNQIEDISALEGLGEIHELDLSGNNISDISALEQMTQMDSLNLRNNQISDIGSLSKMTQLWELKISNNQISDISALENLEELRYLSVSDNQISDLTPIQNLTNLEELYVNNNLLTTVPDLTGLTELMLYYWWNDEPADIFSGNQILRDEFTGKFAEALTDEWLDLNSYVLSGETPVITVQPESAVGEIGDTITFAVKADGAVSYIWYYSADDGDSWKLLKTWEGYDTDALSFELTSNRLNYLYHCVLTGSDGSTVTTDDVYVQETGLTIVTQPMSVTASIGDTVTYTVEALKAVSYSWYYSANDGESWSILKNWDGYDTAELSFEVTSNRLNYLYHCVVKGSDGTTLTTDDVYVEEQGFAILTQPENVTASIGDRITFKAEAAKAVSYNWYYSPDSGNSWKLLKSWEGYDTNTLSFEVTSNRLGYLYHCVIKGSNGTTLTTDDVYVEEQGFAILTQPESVTASIGDTVTFVTEAAKAVSYNWYYSADGGDSWKLLKTWDGYNTNTLSFEVTSNRVNYLYHCVVKGSDGTTLTTDAVSIETK